MQLDLFEHSRDVVLRNAAIDALRERDTGASARALAALAAEYCARLLLGLLLFERQGLHADLVAGRRKLREAHPGRRPVLPSRVPMPRTVRTQVERTDRATC